MCETTNTIDNKSKEIETKVNCESDDRVYYKIKSRFLFGLTNKPSDVKWVNVIWLFILHITAIYSYIYGLLNPVRLFTVFYISFLSIFSGLGMSVGGHRLWAHKSFKARLPLRIFLLILQTMTCNGSALSYARDHRTHHKWTDQEQDPKNPSKGFFYAHIGWWLLKKKQLVKDYGNKLSFDDLYDDPLLVFQHKFYYPLMILFAFIIPTVIPHYCWGENILTAFLLCGPLRVCVILHHLFTVNSLAHFVGWRPYDRFMKPTENHLVIWLSLGEGNHNYHHTFPWDYTSSEKRWWEFYSPATLFIEVSKIIGLAYDLKRPSNELIHQVIERKGIPEYFENKPNRGLCIRIIIGAVDWIIGGIVSLWPVLTIITFKMITCRDFIIISKCFQPYIGSLADYWFCPNFIVYY